MQHPSFDPVEQAAWEIYVQLVASETCANESDAAATAFRAAQVFLNHCKQRRESEKPKSVSKTGDDAAQARAQRAMKQRPDHPSENKTR
jgi:hypothetical protein